MHRKGIVSRLLAAACICAVACKSADDSSPGPDAALVTPDAALVTPDAALVTPDAALATPDATVGPPDATPVTPDAALGPPDAAAVPPDAQPDAQPLPPDAAMPPNIVFVTSTSYVPSALGGLAGADADCAARATAAGLPGHFVAWLSTSTIDAHTRIGNAAGWVRVDGLPFTDSLADKPVIYYPPRLDELGAVVPDDAVVVTGTGYTGLYAGDSCGDWTSAGDSVQDGLPAGGAGAWTTFNSSACSKPSRLYCFQIDAVARVKPAPVAGRLAFVSESAFDPSLGVAGADAQCAADAASASAVGTFKALIATASASAASRFDAGPATQPWVRVDGIPLAPTAADFMAGRLVAPIDLTLDGPFEAYTLWLGAHGTAVTGSLAETCQNWTSASASDAADTGITAIASTLAFDRDSHACNFPVGHLVCLQE